MPSRGGLSRAVQKESGPSAEPFLPIHQYPVKKPQIQCLGSPPASIIYIHHFKRDRLYTAASGQSPQPTAGCVLLMPFKFLPFYPVWVLKKEKRNYPALEATLPPPSPPSSVKHRAKQPSYIGIKGERRLFWGQLGCRDVNAAGGRSLGHRHGTSSTTQPDTGSLGAGTNQGQAAAVPVTDCNCSASQDGEGFLSVFTRHAITLLSLLTSIFPMC